MAHVLTRRVAAAKIEGMSTTSTKRVTLYNHVCLRCGRKWESLTKRPRQCRKCWRYDWDKPKG
uniref:Uncharacterized protein n=1 Tax=viral metagenome TaxID=1070528 RepID=A0A6M3LLY7_9ZZZZ